MILRTILLVMPGAILPIYLQLKSVPVSRHLYLYPYQEDVVTSKVDANRLFIWPVSFLYYFFLSYMVHLLELEKRLRFYQPNNRT